MKTIANYEIIETLSETRTAIIFRGRQQNTDATVIIKLLKSENTSKADIAQLQQEYEIIKTIESPGVIHTHEIVKHEDSLALILEDFNGVPLQQKIIVIKNDFGLFLSIAIEIANTLGEIHQSNIIHKDINPSNILIALDNSVVKITNEDINSI